MKPGARYLQRHLDGCLTQAEAAAVERILAEQPRLQQQAVQLASLDALLRQRLSPPAPGIMDDRAARILARLPTTSPQRHLQFSLAHAGLAVLLLGLLGLVVYISEHLRGLLPMSSIAVILAFFALLLVVATRPLLHLEASLMARFFRQRVVVGDGEVWICRGFGVALLLVVAHIGGWWL